MILSQKRRLPDSLCLRLHNSTWRKVAQKLLFRQCQAHGQLYGLRSKRQMSWPLQLYKQ